jgi:parallel beta-helix repeat protein
VNITNKIKSRTVICFIGLLFSLVRINATSYYSDPVSGNMSNAGTSGSPWASLESIFVANKTFKAGDTIFLRDGNHGFPVVKGVNSGNVVITPQVGHFPIITRMKVSGAIATPAAFWKLFKLTFQSESTSGTIAPSYSILELFAFSSYITVSHCNITSNTNTSSWTRNDWRLRCNRGLTTSAKLNANHIIENNIITNVAFGLTIGSSKTIVRNNVVQNFTNDATRVLGSDIIFENNKIYDLIKVMTRDENHDDMFQAWTTAGAVGQDTLKNNIIRNNLFVNTTDTIRQFRGNAQGIGCFDGVFKNWRVENNIVMVDHWHGIAFYGGENCIVINNTVLDPYPYTPVDSFENNGTNIGPAWILVDKKPNGPNSTDNVVKNNLVSNNVFIGNTSMGTASNNIAIGALSNYSNYFVDVQNIAKPLLFDLQLKAGSVAIDAGEITDAPSNDFQQSPRPQGLGIDIGAYERGACGSILTLTASDNPLNGIYRASQKIILTGDIDVLSGNIVILTAPLVTFLSSCELKTQASAILHLSANGCE